MYIVFKTEINLWWPFVEFPHLKSRYYFFKPNHALEKPSSLHGQGLMYCILRFIIPR